MIKTQNNSSNPNDIVKDAEATCVKVVTKVKKIIPQYVLDLNVFYNF